MGCFPDKKSEQFKPTKENEKKIKKIFKNLKEMHEESETENFITLESLQVHFIENPYFAKLLYNFMAALSFNGKVYKKHYLQVVETLLADSYLRPLSQFMDFSKLELFGLIIIGEVKPDKKLIYKINYEQASSTIELILRMFLINSENYNPNLIEYLKTLSMSMTDYYFEKSGLKLKTIPWKEFIHSLSKQYQFIDNLINSYFSAKFLNYKLQINLPELNESEAELLHPDTLKLFVLVNKMFSKSNKLTQIYKAEKKDFNFEQLFESLKKFSGPTLMLFQHIPESQNEFLELENKPEIFGAFMSMQWKKSKKMQGDYNTFLFQYTPKFYITQIQEKNYPENPIPCYLYYSKKNKEDEEKSGLGFGSQMNKKKEFKLWIDESLQTSYCKESDSMFEEGNLVSSNHLNIQKIEVWGINVLSNHEIFQLTENKQDTNISQIKLTSDKENVKYTNYPVVQETNDEIIPRKLKGQPQPYYNDTYQDNNQENEFRPKSSIFKNKNQSAAPRDASTKKMINQLLEEHSYRLTQSQLVQTGNNSQPLYVSEVVEPPNVASSLMKQ